MKNQDETFNMKIQGEITGEVKKEETRTVPKQKSGGNAPSDLGAINKSNIASSSNTSSRSNLQMPNKGMPSMESAPIQNMGGRQKNMGANNFQNKKLGSQNTQKKSNEVNKTKKQAKPNKEEVKNKKINPKDTNPIFKENKMKNFNTNKQVKDPRSNASSKLMQKGKGIFNGRNNGRSKLSSLNAIRNKNKKTNTVQKVQKKTSNVVQFVKWFMALPVFLKVTIVVGTFAIFLSFIIIILIIAASSGGAEANRDMKSEYIQGNYTEEELCEYLNRNGYLNMDDGTKATCEDTAAYKYFVNFKEVMDEYQEKYKQYRFKVNVELLYETLAYHFSDEDTFEKVSKEEIEELIDAMKEEIKESCVIKSYNKKTKICTEKKYVYPLYEFSLDKYISYLKYGKTSTHPNYSNKPVKRKCGEGKNVDYVFGYGLVNTSFSPFTEFSDCPNNPVKSSDYDDNSSIPTIQTTLEELDILGGVEPFSHINHSITTSEKQETSEDKHTEAVGSGKGAEIAAYALQFVGGKYVYGGDSLTEGTDCSGFINLVYAHFGYSVPRTTSTLLNAGQAVSCDVTTLQAGDVILYGNPVSHAALYTGGGRVVHAKGAKYGITTDVYNYHSKGIAGCRRFVN